MPKDKIHAHLKSFASRRYAATHVHSIYFVLHVALALALAFTSPWCETSAMLATLCRELLEGTNEGRQALFGSALEGPLAALVVLPWQWVFPPIIAVRLGAATGWLLALFVGLQAVELPRRLALARPSYHLPLAVLMICAEFASGTGANPQAAVFAACGLYAFRCGAHWVQLHRMGDLIGLAAGLAGLVLCGLAGWCVALAAALFMPVGLLNAPPALRRRVPAVLLLGLLPAAYALGVWTLMNRLVFGDPLFFLRPLAQPALAGLARPALMEIAHSPLGYAGAILLYTLTVAAVFRNRPLAISTALLLPVWGVGMALNHFALGWVSPGLVAAVFLVAAWNFHTARAEHHPGAFPLPILFFIGLLLAIGFYNLPDAKKINWHDPDPVANRGCLNSVLAQIAADTPHGALFVCGFSGLALLDTLEGPPPGNMPVRPCLDLHIGKLRHDYHGHDLYILVPDPHAGRGAADAVQRTHGAPGVFALERAMRVEMDLPGWTLRRIIGAPTQKQFDEWDPAE